MRTDDYSYNLPAELIAQHPLDKRDEARMMIVDRDSGRIQHRHVKDLPRVLGANDLLILNDTRVLPARLFGYRQNSGGKVELLFLEQMSKQLWEVMLKSARRPKIGEQFLVAEDHVLAIFREELGSGRALVEVMCDKPLEEILEAHGVPPLPPYIKRDSNRSGSGAEDKARYQTIYARRPGAIAAPTAGLHFTKKSFCATREERDSSYHDHASRGNRHVSTYPIGSPRGTQHGH